MKPPTGKRVISPHFLLFEMCPNRGRGKATRPIRLYTKNRRRKRGKERRKVKVTGKTGRFKGERKVISYNMCKSGVGKQK